MSAGAETPDMHDPSAASSRQDAQPPSLVPDLRAAVRSARAEEAERARAVADLQDIARVRLEVLRDRLDSVMAQVPSGIDLFDMALTPAGRPRLFIDTVAFVEMGSDRRRYHVVQDTRAGRLILYEGERVEAVVEAVTAYVARRLVERDRALAGVPPPSPAVQRAAPSIASRLRRAWRLGLEYLGLAALVVVVWVGGHVLYQWIMTGHGMPQ